MSTDFNWWLLVVGVVVGGALMRLVLADSRRREDEVSEEELNSRGRLADRQDPQRSGRWTRTTWTGCCARTAGTWASRPRTRWWTPRASVLEQEDEASGDPETNLEPDPEAAG